MADQPPIWNSQYWRASGWTPIPRVLNIRFGESIAVMGTVTVKNRP